MIELDELLYGEPTKEQVREFFRNGEFHEEHYEVAAIKKHLRTEKHRKLMYEYDFSIEEMLNGRIECNDHTKNEAVDHIHSDWNEWLGYEHFT